MNRLSPEHAVDFCVIRVITSHYHHASSKTTNKNDTQEEDRLTNHVVQIISTFYSNHGPQPLFPWRLNVITGDMVWWCLR